MSEVNGGRSRSLDYTPHAELELVGYGSYKGHKLIYFGACLGRTPFGFGYGKARDLLDAIEANGVEAVAQVLADFVAEAEAKHAERDAA